MTVRFWMKVTKMEITIALLLAGFLAVVLFMLYAVNIYEVSVDVTKKTLYADNESETIIAAVPINSMGKRALFRYATTSFDFREGRELIEILSEDTEHGLLIIRSKDKAGKVIILVKPELALFPTEIELIILPNAG